MDEEQTRDDNLINEEKKIIIIQIILDAIYIFILIIQVKLKQMIIKVILN